MAFIVFFKVKRTVIRYGLVKSSEVQLTIYDVLGRPVYEMKKHQYPGDYQIEWDATGFSSGVYYYRIEAGNFVQTRKMIYLK